MSRLMLAVLAVFLGSCTDLPALQGGVCGNGVVDAGEDCDSFAPAGLACRAPQEAPGCRFACAPGGAGCPAGWGCGLDGVCREPTARYEALPAVVQVSAAEVKAGDFDGDGRAELLTLGRPDVFGRQEVRVHFFDEEGRGARSLVVPQQMTSPQVADVNRDGIDDLVAGVGLFAGVTAFLGARDQSLKPLAYPSFSIPVDNRIYVVVDDVLPARADGLYAASEVLLFATFTLPDNQGKVNLLSPSDGEAEDALLWLPKGPSELATDVKLGQFLDATPCKELVFGFQGEDTVQVFSPCALDGVNFNKAPGPGLLPPLPPVSITLPLPITGPIFPVDMDGDGNLDLLVGVKGQRTAVAYGDGALGFRSKPGGGVVGAASLFPVPRGIGEVESGLGMPVAVGDLNGDKLPDFVMNRGVFVSLFSTDVGVETLNNLPRETAAGCGLVNGALIDCPIAFNLGSPWTEGEIADLNRDGLPDVVVGSGEAGVEFFNGTPLGIPNRFAFPTTGAAARFSVGDFDGDFVLDVAFRELGVHGKAAGGSPVGDSLSVLFGRPNASPEPPVSMGRFERIDQVIAARYFAQLPTTTQDVGVISSSEDGLEQRVSVLGGSGDRQLLAPFGLQVILPSTETIAAATALVSADFDGDQLLDLGALAFDSNDRQIEISSNYRFWTVRGEGNGNLVDARFSEPLPYLSSISGGDEDELFAGTRTLLMAGDLDGDGKAEVVHVALDESGQSPSLAAIARPVLGADGKPTLTFDRTLPLPAFAPGYGQGALADLDGDGFLDLLVLASETAPTTQDGLAPLSRLLVLWGDGQGSFDTQAPLVLVPPAPSTALRGFALVNRAGGKDLVLAGDAETVVARGDRRTFSFLDERLPRAVRVWAADVTGDGVEDLALLESNTLRLFRGVPAKELGDLRLYQETTLRCEHVSRGYPYLVVCDGDRAPRPPLPGGARAQARAALVLPRRSDRARRDRRRGRRP